MDKIDEFLNNFSKGTGHAYRSWLKKYFRFIGKDPNTYFPKGKGQYTQNDLEAYEKDVKQFWQSIKDDPPNTIKNTMGAIKVFLMENYVDLSGKVWKDLRTRTKGSRAVVEDYIPTRDDLKKLLSHANAFERAFFLTLVSSGMRIGETCKVKESDIDFTNKPVKIDIKREYTKTGNRRVTFVTDECAEAIKEWLKEKPAWLENAVKKLNFPQYKKSVHDERIFPLASNVARAKWNRLLEKTGKPFTDKDKSTKEPRYKLHPHCLRKFYRTNLPGNGMDTDIVEALMGHEEYLTRVYAKHTAKDLGDRYLAAMPKVTIFSSPVDLTDVNKEIAELKKDKERMQQQYNEMDQQLRRLIINKLIDDDKRKR